jgi:dihydrodipicolinate synthase/N-acetylneuraminate lyase
MLLEGVFPSIATPFYSNGDLYPRKLEHNVARYSRTQLAGMAVLGAAGEAEMLNDEERRQVLETAIAGAAPDKVMIAGIGRESVRETVALAEYASRLRYDAVLAAAPRACHTQMQRTEAPLEILTYYRAVADHSPLPVLMQSDPAISGYELPIAAVAELAQHPQIVGVVDGSGNPARIAEIVRQTEGARRTVTVTTTFAAVTRRMLGSQMPAEQLASASALGAGAVAVAAAAPATPATMKTREKEVGFAVFTSNAGAMLGALEAGACGALLSFAACAPQCCYEVWTAWKERDEVLAIEKQERIREASIRVAGQMGVPGLKYACDLNGYYGGRPRLPLLPLTADQQDEVKSRMADIRY